jgi:hypothetical protein
MFRFQDFNSFYPGGKGEENDKMIFPADEINPKENMKRKEKRRKKRPIAIHKKSQEHLPYYQKPPSPKLTL